MNHDQINERERRRLQQQMFALEDEKEAVEARYKYLLQQARVGLFSLNAEDCSLRDANTEMVRMFLCESLDELRDHLTPEAGKDIRFIDPRHIANLEWGEAVSFSLHSFRRNGDSFWARIILQALEGQEHLEGIITDITDQVRADIELRQAIVQAETAKAEADEARKKAELSRQEAEEANQAKSRFLANISHEIRTPLNGIIGFSEIIMASMDCPEGQLYAGKILDESENLMILINQLLDLSKIEAHQMELNYKAFLLEKLLSDTVSSIRLRARNKGLKLSVELDKALPRYIWADAYRLRQILLNLLSNAVKFTSRGSILLSVKSESAEDDQLKLRFEVHDTGIGIPAEKHDSVFDSFVQADSSISRKFGGTGLGISISRELVDIMDGNIWMDSEEGKGSTFYFTVSCRRAEASDLEDNQNLPTAGLIRDLPEGLKVLVVEDYPTNREIVQHHLNSAGCLTDMAANGIQALKMAEKGRYDIVLMDVHMPEMDGLEATRKIRSLPAFQDIPILGMTANALTSNQEDCRSAGMNDVLMKPLRRKELLKTMDFWIRQAGSTSPVWQEGQKGDPLDFEAFLEDMDGDRDAACEIVLGFMDNLERQIQLLADAINAGELVTVHREAHSIKGGALNLGASDLASWALALEKGAKEGNYDIIPHLYQNLCQSADTLLSCRDSFSSIG